MEFLLIKTIGKASDGDQWCYKHQFEGFLAGYIVKAPLVTLRPGRRVVLIPWRSSWRG